MQHECARSAHCTTRRTVPQAARVTTHRDIPPTQHAWPQRQPVRTGQPGPLKTERQTPRLPARSALAQRHLRLMGGAGAMRFPPPPAVRLKCQAHSARERLLPAKCLGTPASRHAAAGIKKGFCAASACCRLVGKHHLPASVMSQCMPSCAHGMPCVIKPTVARMKRHASTCCRCTGQALWHLDGITTTAPDATIQRETHRTAQTAGGCPTLDSATPAAGNRHTLQPLPEPSLFQV